IPNESASPVNQQTGGFFQSVYVTAPKQLTLHNVSTRIPCIHILRRRQGARPRLAVDGIQCVTASTASRFDDHD
uniref:Uncharacterized protein n=1 Tax=Triticum urartu TaxID=4572 RepID=A0A8R7Q0E9_TRIUA